MLNGKPLAVELFAGTFGHSRGWLESGGCAIGFDLDHLPHHGPVPDNAMLVLQDVLTLDGAQFKDADVIFASPPCQAYSYLAMPWSRSKCPLCKGTKHYYAWQLTPDRPPDSADVSTWGDPIDCDCKENSAKAKELRRKWETEGPDNRLFDDCFRIQREAIAATGHPCPACCGEGKRGEPGRCSRCAGIAWRWRYIPLIIENVRGAIPWVGKRDMPLDDWNRLTQPERIKLGQPNAAFGSFMLWGDVARIGNRVVAGRDLEDIQAGWGRFGVGVKPEGAQKRNPDGTAHPQGSWFRIADSSQGDRARKVPGFRFDGSGGSFQTASVEASGVKGTGAIPHRGWTAGTAISLGLENYSGVLVGMGNGDGTKTKGRSLNRGGKKFGTHNMGSAEEISLELGTKIGGDWFSDPKSTCRKHGSRSNARKAASALIARIPPALSAYLAEQLIPKSS